MSNSQVATDRLKRILESKGIVRCPMCGGNHFQVVDGYFSNFIQNGLNGFALGGPSVPSVMIICAECGFMSQHAIGVLDPESINHKPSEK